MKHFIHYFSDDQRVRLDCLITEPAGEAPYLNRARPAVIVCPGGGYNFCSNREAESVALKYAAAGFQAFVFRYTVGQAATFPTPLLELCRAMQYVRENAEQFHLLPDRVAVCGFSAGGHLAASLGVYWNDPAILAACGATGRELRPDMLILGYPVISTSWMENGNQYARIAGGDTGDEMYRKLNLHLAVNADTPPTFLTHGTADPAVPVRDSLQFAAALEACNVPFEMHIYSHATHGYSSADDTCYEVGDGDPVIAGWLPLSIEWLRRNIAGELDRPVKKAVYSAKY